VALDPNDACTHRELGVVYLAMKQFDLAGVHFDRAVTLNPNDVSASGFRGLWLAHIGQGEEALKSLDSDRRRDPFSPNWYWEFRGIALFQLRRHQDAIDAFNRMDLVHWWNRCYLAACYAHLGIDDGAHDQAAEVLRLKPDFVITDVERSEHWRDAADLKHLKDGLRDAGLPG